LEALQSQGYAVLTLTAGDEDGWTILISGTLAVDPDGVIDDRFLVTEEGNRPRRIAAFRLSCEAEPVDAPDVVAMRESMDPK
jgi:hypothetical protein